MRNALQNTFFGLLLATTVFAEESVVNITISGPDNQTISQTGSEANEEKWQKLLIEGREVLLSGNAKVAVTKYFDPITTHYEKTYKNSPKDIFCTHGGSEVTLFYLMSAAVAADLGDEKIPENLMPKVFKATGRDTRKTKDETIVLSSTWAEAYFLKSYALVEQGKVKEAQIYLKKALHLSPCNATYWSELGHTHQMLKNWDHCLKAYQLTEEAADFSGDNKNQDKARAWRGIGFVYIETGKLDDAEEHYYKCLELNPNDKMAKSELKYIAQLREKSK